MLFGVPTSCVVAVGTNVVMLFGVPTSCVMPVELDKYCNK